MYLFGRLKMSEPSHLMTSDIPQHVGTVAGKAGQALAGGCGTVYDVPPHSDIYLLLVKKRKRHKQV